MVFLPSAKLCAGYCTLLLAWLFLFTPLRGQEVVRGRVIDQQTLNPLEAARVLLLSTDPVQGTLTDENGYFRFESIPPGRHILQVRYLGYEDVTRTNLILSSAKELVLEIQMVEQVSSLDEVVIEATVDKMNPVNELVTVSGRTFSMEEALRFAGTRNDPARMAQSFAGVSGVNDSRNDIIIRGNSPTGVLWRLEGIDTPNPNHFGALGTTGGPVSMLNANTLDNSDFITGAFPSEYGNALAGVFDLSLRSGNDEHYEFMGQLGFNGLEAGAEGPLPGSFGGSFLINFRYSTLGIFKAMGLNFGTGTAVPEYQDLVFKLDLPTRKAGRFSVFGLGGSSSVSFLDSEEEDPNFFAGDAQDLYNRGNSVIVGLSHTYLYNETTYGKLTLAFSNSRNSTEVDTLSIDEGRPGRYYAESYDLQKYMAHYQLNKKFNVRNSLRAGLIVELLQTSLVDSIYDTSFEAYRRVRNFRGNTGQWQGYVQWLHRFSDRLKLTAGLHTQQLWLNQSFALEPRLGLSYQLDERQTLSLGLGLHSQTQPLQIYFLQTRFADGSVTETNRGLGFTRSRHLVLGYDRMLGDQFRLKIETYYQSLLDAPVESKSSSFSLLNAGADFAFPAVDSLINEGSGENYGLELTLERFFSRGYYFLLTASLFNSTYKGSDGIRRNTAFNGNYVINALGGKEFVLGKQRRHTLSVDGKMTLAGGRRYTEIDLEASQRRGEAVYLENQAYEKQYPAYFRFDLKTTFRMNGKKVAQEWSLDLQNLTNRQNVFNQTYNARSGELETTYQIGLFPIVQYRLLF